MRLKKEVMLAYSDKITEITKPLIKVNINFFSYSRVYENGYKIDLNNSPQAAEYVYYKTNLVEIYDPEISPSSFQENVIVNSHTFPENKMLQVLREQFDIDHLLVSIIKKENYYEVWNLGTSVENNQIYNVYLNQLTELIKFRYHFRNQAKEAIKEFKRYPLICKKKQKTQSKLSHSMIEFEESRYILDDDTLISQREKECLYLLSCGKSAKQIADMLRLSPRTVESYIAALKIKLRCTNISQLIYKASQECLI